MLDTYEEGAIIEMKVVISTFHWVSGLYRPFFWDPPIYMINAAWVNEILQINGVYTRWYEVYNKWGGVG